MNAYLHHATARALLAQSRAYTQRKRAEREAARRTAELFSEFRRIGFGAKAAAELAAIQVTLQGDCHE